MKVFEQMKQQPSYLLPSDLNTYPSIISEDCYLQQLEKISDADKEHCALSEITQIIKLVF